MSKAGILLGFDYGKRHIGVAVGQRLTGTATALSTLEARHGEPDWKQISALVDEWQPECFVVGLPYRLDGTSSGTTDATEHFARQLESRYRLPVYRQDERLTSREAEVTAAQYRRSGRLKRRHVDIDRIAAQIILQTWLDQRETERQNGDSR